VLSAQLFIDVNRLFKGTTSTGGLMPQWSRVAHTRPLRTELPPK